jgi:hypothetical protein
MYYQELQRTATYPQPLQATATYPLPTQEQFASALGFESTFTPAYTQGQSTFGKATYQLATGTFSPTRLLENITINPQSNTRPPNNFTFAQNTVAGPLIPTNPGNGKNKIIWLYNFDDLNTQYALKKLHKDLSKRVLKKDISLIHENAIESIAPENTEAIILFYYLPAFREARKEISRIIEEVGKILPKIPIHLIMLKNIRLLDQVISLPSWFKFASIETFPIYEHNYGHLALYLDRKPSAWTQPIFHNMVTSYDNLHTIILQKMVI